MRRQKFGDRWTKRGQISRVEGILDGALSRYGIKKDLERYRFVLYWKNIVGDELAKRSRPECLRGGALVVRVPSSAWAQELSFHKSEIIKRLQPYLSPSDTVDDVRFQVERF